MLDSLIKKRKIDLRQSIVGIVNSQPIKYENITFKWYYVLDFGKLLRYNMRVRVETNKKEAIGVAPFSLLINNLPDSLREFNI